MDKEKYKTTEKKNYFEKILNKFNFKEKGFKRAIYDILFTKIEPITSFWYIFLKIFGKKYFFYENKKIKYFYHKYNHTWMNERTLEIPIGFKEIKNIKPSELLEVGNVLKHYNKNLKHKVIDKYEKIEGVINEDITDYETKNKYSKIICISTLEHVGFDEIPKDNNKTLKAYDKMISMLTPKGELFVTIPLGQNPHLDEFIKNKKITFDQIKIYKRMSFKNNWKEIINPNLKELNLTDHKYPGCKYLLVGKKIK